MVDPKPQNKLDFGSLYKESKQLKKVVQQFNEGQIGHSQEFIKYCSRGVLEIKDQYTTKPKKISLLLQLTQEIIEINIIDLKNIFISQDFVYKETPIFQGCASCISDEGKIYISGGLNNDKILVFNEENKQFEVVAELLEQRKFHSMVYLNSNIYIVGGVASNHKAIKFCEVVSKIDQTSIPIASLNIPTANHTLVSFNQKYIFKIGGTTINESTLANAIERYNISENVWDVVNFQVEQGLSHNDKYFLKGQLGIQINSHQLFVFGGWNEHNQLENSCFVLSFDHNYDQNFTYLSFRNKFSFDQIESYTQQNLVIAGKDEMYCVLGEDLRSRELFKFDGEKWKKIRKLIW